MPQILTTNAVITCPHLGKGTTFPSLLKWQINGGYVCVEGDMGMLACPYAPFPCIGYTLQSMGLNATKIDQKKVMLVTDFNKTQTGLPLLMVETHPVLDQSTPAPIPAGQQAPPQSPELADLVAPIVIVTAPPTPSPFKITPPPPPVPVVVSFSMTTDHPVKWVLTLIDDTPPGQNIDLTNGIPGAVTVVPSGGQWDSPSLPIVVTLMPRFLAGLAPGHKDLFLTGVSKRGLSGF